VNRSSRHLGLRFRILAWAFIPTAIILFAVALVIFLAYQNVVEEQVIGTNRENIRLSANQLGVELEGYQRMLQDVANIPAVFRGRVDEVQRALDAESNRLVVFDGGVLTLDREGRASAVAGAASGLIGTDFSTLPVFAQVSLNHEPAYSDVDSGVIPGVMTAALAVPVFGPDREFGGVVLGMFRLGASSFSSFYGGLIKLRIGEGAATYLVDSSGKIIYHNTPALIGQLVDSPAILEQIRSHELEAWRTRSAAGGEVLASIAPVPGTPWTLVKEEDWSALLAASGTYGRALVVLLGLGLLIPGLVVFIGVRRLTQPILELIEASREVASGNFGRQITLESRDELQQLVEQFNRMSSRLRTTYDTLRAREERLALVVQGTRDGIWDWDVETSEVYFSPRWKSMLGYREDEIAPNFEAWRNLVHPDDLARAEATVREYLQGRSPVYQLEHRLRTKDGGYRWILARGVALRYPDGRAYRLLGSHTDITADKQAEQALRESEERFRATFEQAAVGVAHVGLDGRWLRVNQRLCEMVGYSREDLLQLTFLDVTHPGDRGLGREFLRQMLTGELSSMATETRYVRKDGGLVWVGLTTAVLRDEGGTPRYLISVMQDISERKRAEQALQERLRFEKLVGSISSDFVNLSPEDIDTGIVSALQSIGEFAHGDRAYVFLFSEDGHSVEYTHEWCAEGVLSVLHSNPLHLTAQIPWSNARLRNLERVDVRRVEDLPEEARLERERLVTLGVRSMMQVPMVYRGMAVGFVGFDAVGREMAWGDETAALLRMVGEIIVNALENRRSTAIQAGQRRLLELLATGQPAVETLNSLVRIIESQTQGAIGMVMLLEEGGTRYRVVASSALPAGLVHAVDGMRVDSDSVTCCELLCAQKRLIVEDIAVDPRWAELRPVALEGGLRASWIEPVFAAHGEFVGIFGLFNRQARAPTRSELHTLETAAHLVAVAVDHELAERALRRSEARFRTAFEGAPIGIGVIDPNGHWVEANRELEQMLGYSDEEFARLELDAFSAPEDVARERALLGELFAGARNEFQIEKRYLSSQGRLFWGRLSVAVARESDGKPLFAIAMIEDIDSQKRTQEALRDAYQTLELRVEERTHELAALNEIATLVSQSLDLSQIMTAALDKTMEVLGFEAGVAYRIADDAGGEDGQEADGPYLEPLAQRGMPDSLGGPRVRIPVKGSRVEEASRTGLPVVWDVAHHPNPYIKAALQEARLNEGVSVALMVKERLVGGLILTTAGSRALRVEDLALLSSIGKQVGLAVENARLYDQAEQSAALSERARLARELHDSVTQSLYSVTLYAEAAARLMDSGRGPEARSHLFELGDTAQEALKEMRLLIYELRPTALEKGGLADALQARLEAVEARGGMHADITVEGEEHLPALLQRELYQIAHEALNNVLKHSRAHAVAVELHFREQETALDIRDDGVGFDPQHSAESGGIGLASIRERAARIGGLLEIESQPGKGTHIRVRLPAGESSGATG
jgi:PAS domain S-box-containing protein